MTTGDWILFLGYCALIVFAWNISAKPESDLARSVHSVYDDVRTPVRHERRRDKRSGGA